MVGGASGSGDEGGDGRETVFCGELMWGLGFA